MPRGLGKERSVSPRVQVGAAAAAAGKERSRAGDEGCVRNGTSGCVEGLQQGRQREGKS